MSRKVLVINSGSSTLKFQLFDMPAEKVIAKGMVDRLGSSKSVFEIKYNGEKKSENIPLKTHIEAVRLLTKRLVSLHIINDIKEITGVGHRVVSGGIYFKDSKLLNDNDMKKLSRLDEYAPLHNPSERKGIEAFAKMLPGVPQVAVFDTTFHRTLPEMNRIYSIPYEDSKKYGAYRYGAHGTSHNYVSHQAAKFLHKDYDSLKMVSVHMGSGVSVDAIKDGKSFDISMGFTPISGVTMSSRSGDIDTSLVAFLMEKKRINTTEMIDLLNRKSGLKGISGVSPDMRDLIAVKDTNPRAKLAIDVFVNRIVKYIGSYIAEMNGIDVLIFTAGMGEHNYRIRDAIMKNFEFMGLKIDHAGDTVKDHPFKLTTDDSKITALTVPTDEELMIAREFERLNK